MFGAAFAEFFMIYIGIYLAVGKSQNNTTGKQIAGEVSHRQGVGVLDLQMLIQNSNATRPGWSAVEIMYLWTASYGPTWNGTPWVYVSEVFPTHIRTVSMALLSASQWLWTCVFPRLHTRKCYKGCLTLAQFAIARATPYMFVSIGLPST
jgi:hypothetical protein